MFFLILAEFAAIIFVIKYALDGRESRRGFFITCPMSNFSAGLSLLSAPIVARTLLEENIRNINLAVLKHE